MQRGSDSAANWPCGLLEANADGLITDANPTFLQWTGYELTQLIGRRRVRDLLTVGGRMLYETHLAPLLAMQGHVNEIALDVKRADGRSLPVLLNAVTLPVRARDGARSAMRFAIFAMNDRRSYEKELLDARRAAEAAGAASEVVQRRLSLMADVNLILSGTLRVDVAMQRLATLLASDRFGYCVIVYRDDADHPSVVATAVHPDVGSSASELGAAIERSTNWAASREHPERQAEQGSTAELIEALSSASPRLLPRLDLSEADAGADLPAEFGATVIVPIRARSHHIATVLMTRPLFQPPYSGDDLIEFAGLADRIGLFIDNLRLYGREHERAIAFQQSLLTPPATPPDLDIVTRYLPSADDAMVGGDWYDAFIRPDGATVIVIGDVTGHDHVAAAGMGQLRGLLRSLAYVGCQPPAQLLAQVDVAARDLGVACLATVFVAVFAAADDTATGQPVVTWANAGHLPPAVITQDGEVALLDVTGDVMLGVVPGSPRHNHVLDWPRGGTLLLYTDGLIEDPSRDLESGLAMLKQVLADLAFCTLDLLCDELVNRMSAGRRRDDIALLAIRRAPDS